MNHQRVRDTRHQRSHFGPQQPWSAWVAAVALAMLGSPLLACPSDEANSWYEVVAQAPGPEVVDPAMREAIKESGHPWKVRDRASGVELILIMPGEFMMGSPEAEPDRELNEGPAHRVRLTKAFYLGTTEVTQAQFKKLTESSHSFFTGDQLPVEVSLAGVQAFLKAANVDLPEGTKTLRLPTEAEWEYACRAGTTGPFNFDKRPQHDVLNFNDGVAKHAFAGDGIVDIEWEKPPSPGFLNSTANVGSYPPNRWGLRDMHGNLWEWTADKYEPKAYENRDGVTVDPFVQPTAVDSRTLRGGSWYDSAGECRSASRDLAGIAGWDFVLSNRIGFRVARTP